MCVCVCVCVCGVDCVYCSLLADMSSAMLELTPDLRSDPCVEHALGVWNAWSLGNYTRLFRLYACGPSLSQELMRLFVERERKSALRVIIRA